MKPGLVSVSIPSWCWKRFKRKDLSPSYPGEECWGTLLPFVKGAGEVHCIFWVIKSEQPQEFVIMDVPYITRGKWPRFYSATKSGYMNQGSTQLVWWKLQSYGVSNSQINVHYFSLTIWGATVTLSSPLSRWNTMSIFGSFLPIAVTSCIPLIPLPLVVLRSISKMCTTNTWLLPPFWSLMPI